MPRTPKPWFWKNRRCWYVTIAGRRHNLGSDRRAAKQRYHELMAKPAKRVVRSDSVESIVDLFLEWTKRNRAPLTSTCFLNFCQSFIDSLPAGIYVGELKPFHVH